MNQTNKHVKFLYQILIAVTGTALLISQGCKATNESSAQIINDSLSIASSTPSLESGTHTSTQDVTITPTPEIQSMFLYTRGIQSLRAEEYKDAINTFTMVIKRMPNLAIAYKGRGAAYYGLNRMDLAEEALNKALAIDMDLGGAYLYLGLIHRDSGNLEKARKNLIKAVNLIHKIRERWEFNKAQKALSDLESG